MLRVLKFKGGGTYRNILITYGIGMVITTSSNSRCSTPCSSSYSIFTSHPPCPFSEGQQLTTFVNKFKLILDYLFTLPAITIWRFNYQLLKIQAYLTVVSESHQLFEISILARRHLYW